MSSAAVTEQSIPARFAQIVARHPRRIAIGTADTEWTYAELDARATALAIQILDRLGEKPEPVVLLMSHGALLLAAIFGALKAGKLFLALDPSHPRERLAAMLADSGAQLLLADETNLALANSLSFEQLRIWEVVNNYSAGPTNTPLPEVSPETGAWLMYTSGSTGTPLGVWQDHRSVVHHSEVYRELIQITPDDRMSLLTSCSLSASGTNLFGALLNGATLSPFHVRSRGIEHLAAWLQEQRINVYHSVPTVFRHLARAAGGNKPFENMRLIRLGGEPLSRGDVEIFRQKCPEACRLLHSFSSTETGLISALMMNRETILPGWRVPIGHATSDVEVLLLDEKNRPVRNGGEGKIAVRSAFLRQGYWRKPALTAEKFQADPGSPRIRTFISADLGRFLADGSLEFLGRMDQMVKIRGQRVDPGAVEAALLATDLVKEAAVTVPEDASGDRRLVAYFVPRPTAKATPKNIRQALRVRLPEHMVPNDFVGLEKLPQTVSGKIDRRALPPPPQHGTKAPLRHGAKPRKGIEKNLALIWKSVLEVSHVGRHDDFFDLGGDSLRSVEVLVEIEKTFGVVLPPSTLVEYSNIEQLAGLLAGQTVFESGGPLILMRASDAGRPLFLVHSGEGDLAVYGQLARQLSNRPIYGIQSAGLNGEGPPLTSIPAAARRYLREITRVQPDGPYLLGGSRMGALVAFELARQLARQRRTVGMVAMLDFLPPKPRRPFAGLIDVLTGARDHLRILGWTLIRVLRRNRKADWLPDYRAFVAKMNCHSRHNYSPAYYPGTITVFLTADRKAPEGERRIDMSQFAREVRVITISGERTGMFTRPAVDELARQLQTAIALGEADNRTTAMAEGACRI